MPQIDVTLPSGAKGSVRGLKGRELNLFANKAAARRGRTSLQILKNVWVKTDELGPLYNEQIDWDKSPQCDRFVALFYARIATYGTEYAFHHKCTNVPECGKKFEWVEDLSKRPIKPLPESSIDTYLNGNKFMTEAVDPEGSIRKVQFQLLVPKLEMKIDQVQGMAPKEKVTASLAQRIYGIEGLESGKGPIKRFLEDMDAGPLYDLLEAMDSVDGGIDTEIEVECPHCGEVEFLDLPLGDEFWSPPRRKRSSGTSTM